MEFRVHLVSLYGSAVRSSYRMASQKEPRCQDGGGAVLRSIGAFLFGRPEHEQLIKLRLLPPYVTFAAFVPKSKAFRVLT